MKDSFISQIIFIIIIQTKVLSPIQFISWVVKPGVASLCGWVRAGRRGQAVVVVFVVNPGRVATFYRIWNKLNRFVKKLFLQKTLKGDCCTIFKSSKVEQTLANQGPNSKFGVEVISKALVTKSSLSSILKTQNRGYTNPDKMVEFDIVWCLH